MKDCIIIGKPNVGKTLFAVNFAEYLGATAIAIEVYSHEPGSFTSFSSCIERARRDLVSESPHTTLNLQRVRLRIRVGKGTRDFYLTDSPGISEGIHPDVQVRKAMAQTLRRLRGCDVILHMMDASRAHRPGAIEAVTEVDFQIARYAAGRSAYAIIANKMDLPEAGAGLAFIRSAFAANTIIPVSALRRRGFREVSAFLSRAV